MAEYLPSPRIARHSWGRLELEDGRGFRDAKLFPGGAREWDWNETGTSHSPGVQPADVAELVENGASVVVLSEGRNRRLAVKSETLAWPCIRRPALGQSFAHCGQPGFQIGLGNAGLRQSLLE